MILNSSILLQIYRIPNELTNKMFRKLKRPVKKSVLPGPCEDGLPSHLPIPSRCQSSDSDAETESVMSGFIPVEANQEQDTMGGLNNNDEFRKTVLKSREANSAYIYSWVPRLVDGELCIEGDLLDLDEQDDNSSVSSSWRKSSSLDLSTKE